MNSFKLQKRQNSAIRTCLLYTRREHITISRLHNEMKIISLEQRRNIQLLKLMYHRSKKDVYMKKHVWLLRANAKIQFKLMSK